MQETTMHVQAHSRAAQQIPGGEAAGEIDDAQAAQGAYVLHFQSLFRARRDFAFPCDSNGQVNLDSMTERIRNNYYYARAMTGREVAWPSVRRLLETRDGYCTCGDPGHRLRGG